MATEQAEVFPRGGQTQTRPFTSGVPRMRGSRAGSLQRTRLAANANPQRMAQTLGWFSIGLGLAQLLAPRGVTRLIGIDTDRATLVRAIGLREIVSGAGILSQRRPAPWIKARVAGDVMDLALLGLALSSPRNNRAGRLGAAVAKLFGEEPDIQIRGDLRRFKQLLETGEIPTTEGQPAGRRSAIGRILRKGDRT